MKTYAPTNESKPLPRSLADLPAWEILNRIYRQYDVICLTWGTFNSESGRWEPNQDDLRTLGEWNYMLSVQPSVLSHEGGVWFCVNPLKDNGKRANHLVKDFRFCLLECDVPHADKRTLEEVMAEKEKQFARFLESGLPIEALYDSGGKSIHALVRIYASTAEQFKERVEKVYEYMAKMPGLDPGRKASAQLSRLPGATRGEHKQALLSWSVGPETFEEWEQSIPIDDGLPEIEDLSSLIESGSIEEPRHLLSGLFRKGQVMIMSGAAKTYKSWTSMEQALSISQGKKFVKWDAFQGKVHYVDTELERYDFRVRMKSIIAGGKYQDPDSNDFTYQLLRGTKIELTSLVDSLSARLVGKEYDLIVIDAIYSLLGWREENANEDITDVGRELFRLAKNTGSAILFVHHFSKGSQQGKRGIEKSSGAGAWGRFPDVSLAIDRHTQDFCFNFEATTRTFAEEKPFVAKRMNGVWEVETEMKVERKGDDSLTQFLHLLAKSESQELTPKDWRALMDKAGFASGERAFRSRREKAESAGLIIPIGSPPKLSYRLAVGVVFNVVTNEYELSDKGNPDPSDDV